MSRRLSTFVTRLFVVGAASALFFVGGVGCDLSGGGADGVTLSGQVVNATSQNPIQEAVVTATFTDDAGETEEVTAVTDSVGRFSMTIDVDGTVDVTLVASKGNVTAQQSTRASADVGGISDLNFELNMGGEAEQEPGRPTDMVLASRSTDAIRVQESGGNTVGRLTFQVVDSTGTAIDVDRAVEVSFRFAQQPGDASLTPETVTTNGQGEATVNISSGTTAGVVQVVAETQRPDGTPIESKPVALSIHGALPNKCHFSLGPEQFNFPGLQEFGVTNPIRVFVGDKYGNPVVSGTSVYFSTNAGIIGGSIQTDQQGRGSVTLMSARPLPIGGVATIRAETVGTDDVNEIVDPNNCPDPVQTGNENKIFDTIPVVFSGRTEIRVLPTSAILGQTYSLTVWDLENHNPLAPETTIEVQAEGTKVKAVGHTEVTLDDTAVLDENGDGFGPEDVVTGQGITEFTFRAVEDNEVDEEGPPAIEAITISVTSPNGDQEVVLTPSGGSSGAAKSLSTVTAPGAASIREAPSGEVIVRASETK